MKKYMKKIVPTLFIILLISISFAHPGRTDSKGGHYDRSTGIYHYHHGFPAHTVCGANCPYNNIDATKHNSSSKSISKTTNNNPKDNNTLLSKIFNVLLLTFLFWCIPWVINISLFSNILDKTKNKKHFIIISASISVIETITFFWFTL